MNPTSTDQRTDDQLVRCVLAGEIEVFAEIVDRYETDIWKMVAALLGDRNKSENLVQQCFVNAYEHLHQYQAGRELGAWLRGIARNALREELRRSSRESQRMVHYREYLNVLYSDDGRAASEQDRLANALKDCRQGLASAAATAVELHYEDGLAMEAVAARLGRSVAATKQLLFRARAALRACVESRLSADT